MATKPPEATSTEERVAREIAILRGVDPDAPVTIGATDGSTADFETAWHGYLQMARRLIAVVKQKASRKTSANAVKSS